jgi:hypothetical protein
MKQGGMLMSPFSHETPSELKTRTTDPEDSSVVKLRQDLKAAHGKRVDD